MQWSVLLQADPGLYVPMALGLTFTYNVLWHTTARLGH